jgi:hypothetical protein
VLVDGVDTGKTTPTTLTVPKKRGTKIAITLRLRGYTSTTLRWVDTGDNSQLRAELVKAKSSGPGPTTGRANGSGNKTGSAAGSDDPDGLMRP